MKTILKLAILAAAAACLWPGAAHATARCPAQKGGPRCHLWHGRVTFVDDGDTIDVDIHGDHTHTLFDRHGNIRASEIYP